MTDKTQPLALMLADRLRNDLPTVLRIDAEHAGEELRRQHARIAELEAEIAAAVAGGVQALSAWPVAPFPGMHEPWPEEQKQRLQQVCAEIFGWAPTPPAEQPIGEVVVTKTKDGQIVAVTRQDAEGRILSVIATSDPIEQQTAPKAAPGEPRGCEILSAGEWCPYPIDRYEEAKANGHQVRLLYPLEAAPQQEAQEPVVAYRISDPQEPNRGRWLSKFPGGPECVSEPLCLAKAASNTAGELLTGLAVIRELTGTQQKGLEDTIDAVRALLSARKAAPAIGDELRDTLVAVSAAIAERDDRAAQKMIGEILAASPTPPALSAAPAAAWANPHAALAATFIPGQIWQYRPRADPTWTNTRTPNWLPEFEYRRHPDEAASPTPPAEQPAATPKAAATPEAAPVVKPGAVYAELPQIQVLARDTYTGETAEGFDADDLRDFADRTHALRQARRAMVAEMDMHDAVLAGIDAEAAAPQAAPAPLSDDVVRDAAFEAVRKKLCALPRFSFLSDGYGAVRRVPDKSGSWIAFDAAHALFDPVAVDAALAAQGGTK